MMGETRGNYQRRRSMGSLRKEEEDLALFEDLAMREGLDSPLAMETEGLSEYRISSRKGLGHDLLNFDTDKNDNESKKSGAEAAATGVRRNSSPTRKSPQWPSFSTSRSPHGLSSASVVASTLGSNTNRSRGSPHNSQPSTPTNPSHDPLKPSTPRLSISHLSSTPAMRPSPPTPKPSTPTTRTSSSVARSSSNMSTRTTTNSSTSTQASTGRRLSSGTSGTLTSNSRATPSTPRNSTSAVTRGASSVNKNYSRGNSPVRGGMSRGSSPVRGNISPARGPSPATTRGQASPKGPSKPILAYDFLSEIPPNLRTTSVNSRVNGSLSPSTNAERNIQPGRRHSTRPSNFENHISRSQDLGPNSLPKSHDTGPNCTSKSQDRDSKSNSRSQDRDPNAGYKDSDRGPGFRFSQLHSNRRTSLDDQCVPSRKLTIPEYGLNGRRLSTGSRDIPQTTRPSIARRTTLQQEPAYGSSLMKKSLDSTSCSLGYSQQSSTSITGFKPFMTNSSIPSFYSTRPSALHRKLHQMDSDLQSPNSPSSSDLSTGGAPAAAAKIASWETRPQQWDGKPLGSSYGDGHGKEGSTEDINVLVKRTEKGFEPLLKKDDQRMSNELESSVRTASQTEIQLKKQEEVLQPTGYSQGLNSLVGGQGQLKVYQGLGDMEDMTDNWCCGMEDQCRSFCKKLDCGTYKKFHNAIVVSSPEVGNHSSSSLKSKQEDPEVQTETDGRLGLDDHRMFISSPRIEIGSSNFPASSPDSCKTRSPTPEVPRMAVEKNMESVMVEQDDKSPDWDFERSPFPHYKEPKNGRVSPVEFNVLETNGAVQEFGYPRGEKENAREAQESAPAWDREKKLWPSISYAAGHEVGRQGLRDKIARRKSGNVTPGDTSPLDIRAPASELRETYQSRRRRSEKSPPQVTNGSNWDMQIFDTTSRKQLKEPNFLEVPIRKGDGGMITSASRVQNFSTSQDYDGAVGEYGTEKDDREVETPWMLGQKNDKSSLKIVVPGGYPAPQTGRNSEDSDVSLATKALNLVKSSGENVRKSCNLLEKSFEDAEDVFAREDGFPRHASDEQAFVDILEDTNVGHLPRSAGFNSDTLEAKKMPPTEKPLRFSRTFEAACGEGLYKQNTVLQNTSSKRAVSRASTASATSIDLTRSTDTTSSTPSQYDNILWDDPEETGNPRVWDPKYSSEARNNVIEPHFLPVEVGSIEPQDSERPSGRHGATPYESCSKNPRYSETGLERRASYLGSASQNARNRRGQGENDEHVSQESCFDYFVDFLGSQKNLDLERIKPDYLTDVLVSAHDETRKNEFVPEANNVTVMRCLGSSLVSDKSAESKATGDNDFDWETGKSRSVQSQEFIGQVMEQIVENVNSLASNSPKHLSSFKFGQKKTAAGELENITTLEVGVESPTAYSEPSPSQQKFAKQPSKAKSWKSMSPVWAAQSDDQGRLSSIAVHSGSLQNHHKFQDETSHAGVVAPRLSIPGTMTLAEATDCVLFCSSIVHDLVYRVVELGGNTDLTDSLHGKLWEAEVSDMSNNGNKVEIPIESEEPKQQQFQDGSQKEVLMTPAAIVLKEEDNDELSATHVNKSCGCTIL